MGEMDLTVTRSGSRRVQQMSVLGDPGKVLGILAERGSLSVGEIAETARLHPSKVRFILRKLQRAKLVRVDDGE